MKPMLEILRKIWVYPQKLLATFTFVQAAKFVWMYATGISPTRLQTRVFPDPVWLRPRSTDVRVIYELFTNKELSMHWPLAKMPGTIIDGGANVGYATLALKQRWPKAQVLAIEPDPDNYTILQKNCQLLTDVDLMQCGIWGSACSLRVKPSTRPSAWGLQFEPVAENTESSVRACAIPALIERLPGKHCDLLKLDIEGAETDVFSQADLTWLSRVSVIIIETHGREARQLVLQVAQTSNFEVTPVGEKIMLWRKE